MDAMNMEVTIQSALPRAVPDEQLSAPTLSSPSIRSGFTAISASTAQDPEARSSRATSRATSTRSVQGTLPSESNAEADIEAETERDGASNEDRWSTVHLARARQEAKLWSLWQLLSSRPVKARESPDLFLARAGDGPPRRKQTAAYCLRCVVAHSTYAPSN